MLNDYYRRRITNPAERKAHVLLIKNQINNPSSTREEREEKPIKNAQDHIKELDAQKKDSKSNEK